MTLTGRDHPDTSRAAAAGALKSTATNRRRVLEALAVEPMTDEEVQTALGMPPNTQRPRRVELADMGLVEPSEVRRPTTTGAVAIVWKVTEKGRTEAGVSTVDCRGCGQRLDPFLVEEGSFLHPTCIAPAAPMLKTVREVLTRHQAGQARSHQREIGPSQIGAECDRQIAYRLFRVNEISDRGLKFAAYIGTAVHGEFAQAFMAENERLGRTRYLVEQRVELPSDLCPGGQCDLYDLDTQEAIDLKVVGKTSMQKYMRHGPSDVYRVQAHTYARGMEHMGYTPRSVRLIFLPRWSHVISDAWEWSEPYNRGLADLALKRVEEIKRLGDALDLEHHPERFSLIQLPDGVDCKFCPWHREWPEGEGPADATGCPGGSSK